MFRRGKADVDRREDETSGGTTGSTTGQGRAPVPLGGAAGYQPAVGQPAEGEQPAPADASPAADGASGAGGPQGPTGQAVAEALAGLREEGLANEPSIELPKPSRRLGELLVEQSLVSQAQLVEALLQQSASGKRLGALLVELGVLDERDLARALASQLSLRTVDLRKELPDPALLTMLPESVARAVVAVPLRTRPDGVVEIAVADPMDARVIEQVQAATGEARVELVVSTQRDILAAVDRSYRALAGIERHVRAFVAVEGERRAPGVADDQGVQVEDAPVVQVVNLLITQGLRDRASDIHVEPQDGRVRVRYRIDGALHDVLALPAAMGPALVSRIKIMAGMNIVERRRPQDGQISMTVDGRGVDIRVATTTTIWGEKCVMRLLDKSRTLYRMDDLGMREEAQHLYRTLVRAPFGMVICAGPTGSGKTTTLYATLTEINQSETNVMTIEDPVEYVFPSINQIQINEAAGVTFAGGLKSILRQDPDIILVGEIRDVETARIAVQSALTGHFVLSSLHATDAVSAIQRFLDMGIESFLIASSVIAVLGQRLVRRICPSCKAPYQPSAEEIAFYEESGGRAKTTFWRGEGCNFCANTGYLERVGIYELVRITNEMKHLIVRHATYDEMRACAISQGMRTLRQEAIRLVAEDVTTIGEVVRAIYTL